MGGSQDQKQLKQLDLRIGGMYCAGCEDRIARRLRKVRGISAASVSYGGARAEISYNPKATTPEEITGVIEKLGYRAYTNGGGAAARYDMRRTVGILIMIVALFLILKHFGATNIAKDFPLAEEGMGYGLIFVIGLLTSVHCIAMCGGINISQCVPGATALPGAASASAPASGTASALPSSASSASTSPASGKKRPLGSSGSSSLLRKIVGPSLQYNLGRVCGYTAVGAVVGAIGSAVSFSGGFKGIVQIIAGVFMVVMGLSMFGVLPGLNKIVPRLPRVFGRKIEAAREGRRGPVVVGLLNSLMPCGPLQAMQLYALSTGSPAQGAVSMLLFSLGTLPLMFGIGALSGVLGSRFTGKAMTVGAVLVVFLGLFMFSNGMSLSGFSMPAPAETQSAGIGQIAEAGGTESVTIEDGVQIVRSAMTRNTYPHITVKAGMPVKWIIDAPPGSLNGCNGAIVVPAYSIQHQFSEGENIIEFTPEDAGEFPYSCWMGMIRSSITVES